MLRGALNHFAHDLGHDGLSLVGCLLDLLMAHLDGGVEAAQIGDDADAEGTDATMVGNDDLRNGGHADSVATQHAVHAVLSGSLECGTLCAHIDTIGETDVLLLGNLCGQLDEADVVGLVHVRETWTRREVLATQRMLGEEIDVVGDDHHVANLEGGIHATGGIRYEECLDAQLIHHSGGEGHLLHVVTFIIVEAALHGHDVDTAQLTEDEFAGVALDGGHGEVRNFAVGNLELVSYF